VIALERCLALEPMPTPPVHAAVVTPAWLGERGRVVLCALGLVLAVGAVYWGRLDGPFVFDDAQSISGNPTLTPWDLGRALSPPRETPVASRPLANLSFALGYALHGPSPSAFHTENLLLHCACVLLAFLCLRLLLRSSERRDLLAWFAALAFGVHPMTLEVVLYATQRTETLMAACYLGALLVLLAKPVTSAPSVLALAGLSVLGVCAKEVFVTAPVVLLCCDRAFVAGSFREALRLRWPYYAALCLGFVPALLLQLSGPRSGSVQLWSSDYLLAQARIVPGYFAQALWPGAPSLDYGQLWPQPFAAAWPWLLLTAALVIGAGFAAWRYPRAGFVGVWTLLILAPSSSILSIHTEVGADRRFYLPLIGVLACVCVAGSAVLRRYAWPVGIAACALLALHTRSHAADFRSVRAFWTAAVQARPDNARAHFDLAQSLLREGDMPGASTQLRAALALQDGYAEAHSNLAGLLLAQGQLQQGLTHAERGVELAIDSPIAHYNLALACALNGQTDRALVELEVTLRLQPDHWDAHRKLAQAYLALGRSRAARDHALALLAHVPADPLARHVLDQVERAAR
jgi:protein O-mannosyl-transferase